MSNDKFSFLLFGNMSDRFLYFGGVPLRNSSWSLVSSRAKIICRCGIFQVIPRILQYDALIHRTQEFRLFL